MSQVVMPAQAGTYQQVTGMRSPPVTDMRSRGLANGRCDSTITLHPDVPGNFHPEHQQAWGSSQPVQVRTLQEPGVKRGHALSQPGLPANMPLHSSAARGLATYRDSKSDNIESMARSVVDGFSRSNVGECSVSGTDHTSGSEADPGSQGQGGVLASVMQHVEDLIVEHFWRIQSDLLNTEDMVKAQVAESHAQLEGRLSQLAMDVQADRQQLHKLKEEVVALRSERMPNTKVFGQFYPGLPIERAAAIDTSTNDTKFADLELRLARIQESVQEYQSTQRAMCRRLRMCLLVNPFGHPENQQLADCNPHASPLSPQGFLTAGDGMSPGVKAEDPLAPLPPIHSQLPVSALSAFPAQNEAAFELEVLTQTEDQQWMEWRKGVAERLHAAAKGAATATAGSSDVRADHWEIWQTPRGQQAPLVFRQSSMTVRVNCAR